MHAPQGGTLPRRVTGWVRPWRAVWISGVGRPTIQADAAAIGGFRSTQDAKALAGWPMDPKQTVPSSIGRKCFRVIGVSHPPMLWFGDKV